jgi:hypothetical protein
MSVSVRDLKEGLQRLQQDNIRPRKILVNPRQRPDLRHDAFLYTNQPGCAVAVVVSHRMRRVTALQVFRKGSCLKQFPIGAFVTPSDVGNYKITVLRDPRTHHTKDTAAKQVYLFVLDMLVHNHLKTLRAKTWLLRSSFRTADVHQILQKTRKAHRRLNIPKIPDSRLVATPPNPPAVNVSEFAVPEELPPNRPSTAATLIFYRSKMYIVSEGAVLDSTHATFGHILRRASTEPIPNTTLLAKNNNSPQRILDLAKRQTFGNLAVLVVPFAILANPRFQRSSKPKHEYLVGKVPMTYHLQPPVTAGRQSIRARGSIDEQKERINHEADRALGDAEVPEVTNLANAVSNRAVYVASWNRMRQTPTLVPKILHLLRTKGSLKDVEEEFARITRQPVTWNDLRASVDILKHESKQTSVRDMLDSFRITPSTTLWKQPPREYMTESIRGPDIVVVNGQPRRRYKVKYQGYTTELWQWESFLRSQGLGNAIRKLNRRNNNNNRGGRAGPSGMSALEKRKTRTYGRITKQQ